MDKSFMVGIGSFIAMLATLFGMYSKMKKEILTENEQMMDAKITKCTNDMKSEIYSKIDEVKTDVNNIKTSQAAMHTDIKWIVKRLNGRSIK